MFNDDVPERSEQALREVESEDFIPASPHRANAHPSKPEIEARAPLPPHSPAAERRELPAQADEKPPEARGKERRRGLLHRRPVVLAVGAMLLAAAVGGGYLYLDYAEHFQSTDDAFIAARQSSLAPKVSGYITAVPATANEHAAAGAGNARIDDRDYRGEREQGAAQGPARQRATPTPS